MNHCCDCQIDPEMEHIPGCRNDVCRACGGNFLILLAPEDVPIGWNIPSHPARCNPFFVMLPSRCQRCGELTPLYPGAQ